MAVLSGKCFCQRISYSIEGTLAWSGHCHCRQCQVIHGAAFATWVGIKHSTLLLADPHGTLTVFNSGRADRSFCRICGSHLFFKYTQPDFAKEQHLYFYVAAGSLAAVPAIEMEHIYTDGQAEWACS